MPVQIIIVSPRNGANVPISAGFVQVMGTVNGSCTITASINDGGVVQSSAPTHIVDPMGVQVQWISSIPTGGLTVGDPATLTASANADDGSGVSSQTINIFLIAGMAAPLDGADGAVLAKAGGAKAAAGKKKG